MNPIALEDLKELADKGGMYAQRDMGMCLSHAVSTVAVGASYAQQVRYWGTNRNIATAVSYFEQAAAQGCSLSQYALGRIYYEGVDVEVDHEAATSWLQQSAQEDYPRALWYLDKMADNDPPTVYRTDLVTGERKPIEFESMALSEKELSVSAQRAESGDMLDQYMHVSNLCNGDIIPHPDEEQWLRLSAINGNRDAQVDLGDFFCLEVGLPHAIWESRVAANANWTKFCSIQAYAWHFIAAAFNDDAATRKKLEETSSSIDAHLLNQAKIAAEQLYITIQCYQNGIIESQS